MTSAAVSTVAEIEKNESTLPDSCSSSSGSTTLPAGIDPVQAGSAAGVLTTAQQVGGAVGVALTGVVFFAAGAVVHAFTVCLVALAVCAAGTALLARWVRPATPDNTGRNLAE